MRCAGFRSGVGVALLLGCASPDLDGVKFRCVVDDDCPAEQVCYVPSAAASGFCDEPLRGTVTLGYSGPLSGPRLNFGREVQRGIEACFTEVNRAGGVWGRRLRLRALDDESDPSSARRNAYELLDIDAASDELSGSAGRSAVFAMVCPAGSETNSAAAPLFDRAGRLYFSPVSGETTFLRDGTQSSYVVNVRAGYRDEARALVAHLAKSRIPRLLGSPDSHQRLLLVVEDTRAGVDVYQSTIRAFDQEVYALPSLEAIPRFIMGAQDLGATEVTARLTSYIGNLLAGAQEGTVAVAVVLAVHHQTADHVLRGLKDWMNDSIERVQRLDVQFATYSLVDGEELLRALNSAPARYVDVRDGETTRAYAEGVLSLQVVPPYGAAASGTVGYIEALRSLDGRGPSVPSFEGYIGARLFVEALTRTGRVLSSNAVLETMNRRMATTELDVGTPLSLSPERSSAIERVWGVQLTESGLDEPTFVWDPEGGVQQYR